jgi:hypothetical protein
MSGNERQRSITRGQAPTSSSKRISAKSRGKSTAILEQKLNNAESRQLESFVKTRSMELDSELATLRKKLLEPSTTASQINKISSAREIEELVARGKRIGADFQNSGKDAQGDYDGRRAGYFEGDRTGSRRSTNEPEAETVRMPIPTYHQSQEGRESSSPSSALSPPRGDQLRSLLLRLKQCVEDREREHDLTRAELRDLLLPPHLTNPGDHYIPINELTEVFQLDLAMPVTKREQAVRKRIIHNYITQLCLAFVGLN